MQSQEHVSNNYFTNYAQNNYLMESGMMRRTYECGDKFYAFGVDHVSGVFLQYHDETGAMKIINWSEFEPFNRRLTYDAIQEAIQCGELLISDFKSICSIPIGDYNVYFSELMVADNAPDNFEIPKRLMQKYLNGKPFRVQTLGDYYKVLKLFRGPISFSKVSWYPYCKRSSGVLFEIYNDCILQQSWI